MVTQSQAGAADKPVVVQHSWGSSGSGGPIGALARIQESRLGDAYQFVSMHQERATGGIDIARLREWVKLLREIRPDLVHVRGLGNEGFHGALAARLAGCSKILVSVHGTHRDLSGPTTLRRRVVVTGLEPSTLLMATHVAAVCSFAAERPFMQKHRKKMIGPLVNGVRLDTPTPGVREQYRVDLGAFPDDVVLASVGRLSLEKGHGDLAQALSKVPPIIRARAILVVVGDGPDSEVIQAAYSQAGVRLRMLGRRLDVPSILQAADAFVFPSWHENLSNALLEAMAAGLPVAATRVGGNTEVLERGGGILIPKESPTDLAQALCQLVTDESLRGSLGQEARRVVEEDYSHEAMVDSVDQIYGRIIAEGSG